MINRSQLLERSLSQRGLALAVAAAQGGALVLRYGAHVLAAITLGIADYGELLVLLAAGALVAIPLGLGLKSSAIAHFPDFEVSADRAARRRYVRVTCSAVLLACLFAVAIGFGIDQFSDITAKGAANFGVLAAGFGATQALSTLLMESTKADDRPLTAFLVGGLGGPFITIMGVAIGYIAGGGISTVALAFVLGPLVSALLLLILLDTGPVTHLKVRESKRWLKAGLALVLAGAAQRVIAQAPVIVLRVIVSSEAAGGFGASARLAGLVSMLLGAIMASRNARVAQAIRAGDTPTARRRYIALLRLVGTVAVPVAVVIMLAEAKILGLMGSGFSSFANVGRILLIGATISALYGPVALMLIASGRGRTVTVSYGLTAVGLVVATLVVAERFGAMGVAWCVVVAAVVQNTWQAHALRGVLREANS